MVRGGGFGDLSYGLVLSGADAIREATLTTIE